MKFRFAFSESSFMAKYSAENITATTQNQDCNIMREPLIYQLMTITVSQQQHNVRQSLEVIYNNCYKINTTQSTQYNGTTQVNNKTNKNSTHF